jgi:hypothetical protein
MAASRAYGYDIYKRDLRSNDYSYIQDMKEDKGGDVKSGWT